MAANDAASIRSRFKDTPTFNGDRGEYFGLMEPPDELFNADPSDYILYAIEPADVGFPDRITTNVFGDGYEDLWWAVTLLNGIIDPETEMYAGRIIRVPNRGLILQFLSRV